MFQTLSDKDSDSRTKNIIMTGQTLNTLKGCSVVLSECVVMNLDMDIDFFDLRLEEKRGLNIPIIYFFRRT